MDKFSSTWFISYKNDDDTVTCVCVCPGPDRFQPLLGSRYIHAGISWPSVAGFSCILFTHFIPREFPQFYISIGWSPASGASPLVPVYRATHPWDSYLISNSSPSFASFSREPQNRGTALPSMYRLVVLSFLSPAILYHPVITLSFVRTLHPRVDTFFITRDKVSPGWIVFSSERSLQQLCFCHRIFRFLQIWETLERNFSNQARRMHSSPNENLYAKKENQNWISISD